MTFEVGNVTGGEPVGRHQVETNERVRTVLQEIQRNPDAPIIPLLTETSARDNTSKLIELLTNTWFEATNTGEILATMPISYLASGQEAIDSGLVEVPVVRDLSYFQDIARQLASAELLAAENQTIVLANQQTALKTVPVDAIFTESSREATAPNKWNYEPRNYDRAQVAAVGMGNQLRVLARANIRAELPHSEQAAGNGQEWLFAVGKGGDFGWVKSSDLMHTTSTIPLDQEFEAAGYQRAFVDVPSLEIAADQLVQTPVLTTPNGLVLGNEVWVRQAGEDTFISLPTKNGQQEFKVPTEAVHIGYKSKRAGSAIADFEKLTGATYGWGSNPVWDARNQQFMYGLPDCSAYVANIMRMYGYDLPNASTQQFFMGEKLAGDLKEESTILSDEQIAAVGDYTPGFTFFVTHSHIAVLISNPGEEPMLIHTAFGARSYEHRNQTVFFTNGSYSLDLDGVRKTDRSLRLTTITEGEHAGKKRVLPTIPLGIEDFQRDFFNPRMPLAIFAL
jgi:cell wall-associated NlpC family hydrolase